MTGSVTSRRQVLAGSSGSSLSPLSPWRLLKGTITLTAAWLAERDAAVVGHICVAGATVSRLFVDPVARGLGCGELLLDAAQAYAARDGLTLMLDVIDDGGAAVALYERLGRRLVELRPADWTGPDGRRPVVRIYAAPA